jgi:molybdopterin-containing oxidoreductase family iron-sulfur binding subunit
MGLYGMVIDLKKCIGCEACVIACKMENATPPGISWCRILREERGTFPHVRIFSLPAACNHCADAPCEKACPTGATYRNGDGIILIESSKCIGCRTCMTACPYNVRYLMKKEVSYFSPQPLNPYEIMGYAQHETGTVQKCTFCAHRLEEGMKPACVELCPAEARYFGDLDDPESDVSKMVKERHVYQLLQEMGTDPHVYYLSS